MGLVHANGFEHYWDDIKYTGVDTDYVDCSTVGDIESYDYGLTGDLQVRLL